MLNIAVCRACADSGIFVRGGGGGGPCQFDKKALTAFFFFFFFCFFHFSGQMVNLKEISHFSRLQRGSNIFQGGGGVQ